MEPSQISKAVFRVLLLYVYDQSKHMLMGSCHNFGKISRQGNGVSPAWTMVSRRRLIRLNF